MKKASKSGEQSETIKEYLMSHNQSIAVAESVTAGAIQLAFSQMPESSNYFQGGLTAYNLGQKCRQLDIDPIYAQSCNCVSDQIATAMALQAAKVFTSDWAIGITGYADPVPELNIKTLFAYFAITLKGEIRLVERVNAEQLGMSKVQDFYTETVIKRFAELLL